MLKLNRRGRKPCALAVVIEKDKVLLVQRKDTKVWVLPGGGIDEGETPLEACKRETIEETGLTIHANPLKELFLKPVNSWAKKTYIFLFNDNFDKKFLEKIDKNEVLACSFFSLYHLPQNTFFLHKRWMEEIIKSPAYIERDLNEVSTIRLLQFFIKHPLISLKFLFNLCYLALTKGH